MAAIEDLPQDVSRRLTSTSRTQISRLYKLLLDEIRRGELEPGRVFTYPELTNRFDAPLDVVACSLRLLRLDGLVETRPHLGTRVVVDGETWTVPDRDRNMPLAVYVEKAMRERLADQVYRPETRVPTLDQLADEFGVSVKTVRNGLTPLFDEGFLVTPRGHKKGGTKVTKLVGRKSRAELLQLAQRPSNPHGTLYPAWGTAKTLPEWGRDKKCVVPYRTLKARVIDHRWSLKEAMTTPIGG